MAQDTDTAKWGQKVWAGSIAQLMRAASLAAERVAEEAPYPADYDGDDRERQFDSELDAAWRRAERAREIQIEIVEDGGFNRVLTAIDDLVEIPADHLDRVGAIDIDIGGSGLSPPSVNIEVSRRAGLEIRVCGGSRTWTAGLRHELQDTLMSVERLRPPGFSDLDMVSVALGVFTPLWAGFVILFGSATDWSRGVKVGLGFAIALLVCGSAAFLAWKLPDMELLADRQRPKYQAWKARILTVAGALVIGVVGSIIAASLSKR